MELIPVERGLDAKVISPRIVCDDWAFLLRVYPIVVVNWS